MNADNVTNVLASIVTVAALTTVFTSPRTAAVINAVGNAFSRSLRAAMGN